MFGQRVKKLFLEISEEVREVYGKDIGEEEIEKMVKTFFRHTIKLMRTVSKYKDGIKSIIVPGFGSFKFNPRPLISNINKEIEADKIGVKKNRETFKKLTAYGWRYFRWTYGSGYIFINEVNGDVRCIETKEAKSVKHAMEVFLEKLSGEGVDAWGWVTELRLQRVNLFFAHGVLKYTRKGEFVERYDTLGDVSAEHFISVSDLYSMILFNKSARIAKTFGDFVFFVDDGNTEKRRIATRGVGIKHNYDVSVLDKDTSEVLFYRLGNPTEAARFIRCKGISKAAKSSLIIKALKSKSNIMYGYKWRKEPQ